MNNSYILYFSKKKKKNKKNRSFSSLTFLRQPLKCCIFAVLLVFIGQNYLYSFHSMLFQPCLTAGLFLCLEKRIFRRFKAFLFIGGIIYHLGKENGLKRKFDKNNFRSKTGQKKSKRRANFFSLKINNLQHFLKNFAKKCLPV